MLKKAMWAFVGLFFAISAGVQLLIFTGLLLEQQIEFVEPSKFVNKVEFGVALFIFLIALSVFGYFIWRVIKHKN